MGTLDRSREAIAEARELKVRGLYAQARAVLERALAAAPGDRALRASLADLAFREGRTRRAMALAGEILREDPNDPRALVVMGNALLRRRDPSEALRHFTLALGVAPTEYLWLKVARCHLALRAPAEAHAATTEAARIAPPGPRALLIDAQAQRMSGDADAERAILLRLASTAPAEHAAFFRRLGPLLRELAPREAARIAALFRQAAGQAENPYLLLFEAEALARSRAPADARLRLEALCGQGVPPGVARGVRRLERRLGRLPLEGPVCEVAGRYSRQILFAPVGQAGQERLRSSRVVLIGCGALGSTIANALVRAGVGQLKLVDADRLELSNLQRQTLFDEAQVAERAFKVEAARVRLSEINREVDVVAVVARLDADNAAQLIGKPDLVLDGTDNFSARYLLNDYCVKAGIPWIYGGCAAAYGVAMPIVPGRTPCLRCLFPEPPPAEQTATANTVGILGPIAHLVASLQAGEALKLLTGHSEAVRPVLYAVDLWESALNTVRLPPPEPACPCCGERRFVFLEGTR